MTESLATRPTAVILAAIDARATVCASVARFLDELDGQGEVIVVDASRDGTAELVEARFPGVRVIRRPAGRLAPELWRDGLEAARAPLVAFSTAQMIPAAGWYRAMLACLEETGAAVVGGPIDPPGASQSWCRAAYLHRYIHYLRPLADRRQVEPPGDNAVYRRDALAGLDALWQDGFWEVEIHRALRARGQGMVMADLAVVTYQGGTRPLSFLRQRHAHARRYGASRARGIGTAGRLVRIAAAPLIPAVLLRRIVAALAARSEAPRDWVPALPWLFAMLVVWSVGEALGMSAGLLGPRSRWTARQRGSNVVTCSPIRH